MSSGRRHTAALNRHRCPAVCSGRTRQPRNYVPPPHPQPFALGRDEVGCGAWSWGEPGPQERETSKTPLKSVNLQLQEPGGELPVLDQKHYSPMPQKTEPLQNPLCPVKVSSKHCIRVTVSRQTLCQIGCNLFFFHTAWAR